MLKCYKLQGTAYAQRMQNAARRRKAFEAKLCLSLLSGTSSLSGAAGVGKMLKPLEQSDGDTTKTKGKSPLDARGSH